MTIQIPKDISEVTPQLCRQVFTEICGGRITDEEIIDGSVIIRKYERWKIPDLIDFPGYVNLFNPFTRTQDTKLCDRWLEENELSMTINKNPDAVNGEYLFEVLIYNDVDFRKMNVQVYAELEPFARMVSIILAFNKLEEK